MSCTKCIDRTRRKGEKSKSHCYGVTSNTCGRLLMEFLNSSMVAIERSGSGMEFKSFTAKHKGDRSKMRSGGVWEAGGMKRRDDLVAY